MEIFQLLALHIKLHVKPLHVIFDKLDRHIGKYERDKYLILFPSDEKYKSLLDRIRYFIMLK